MSNVVTFEPDQTTALNEIAAAVFEGERIRRRKWFLVGVLVGTVGTTACSIVLSYLGWP